MAWSAFVQNAIWAAFGALVSWLLSAYYQARNTQVHRLSAAVLGQTTVINEPKDFRGEIAVLFRNKPVKELYQTMILLGNSGTVSLANPSTPITFRLPAHAKVIEFEMETNSPGRSVRILERGEQGTDFVVRINFDVLNKNEFALFRVLSEARFDEKQVKCETSIPELPAAILPSDFKQEWLYEEKPPKLQSRISQAAAGCGLLLLGFALLIGTGGTVATAVDIAAIRGYANGYTLALFATVVAVGIAACIALMFGIILMASALAMKTNFGRHRPFFNLSDARISTRIVGRPVV